MKTNINKSTNLRKIALVRHGETDWNIKGFIQGQSDIPLNQNGILQAQHAADWFSGNGHWDRLFSSQLLRAFKTAEIISKALNIECIILQDLMERKFGALEGLTREERERFYPDRFQEESSVPGLECRPDFKKRVTQTFQDIIDKTPGFNVIIVSHGGWINQLLYHLSDGKIGSGITTLANGGICIISDDGNGFWDLSEINICNHIQTNLTNG